MFPTYIILQLQQSLKKCKHKHGIIVSSCAIAITLNQLELRMLYG